MFRTVRPPYLIRRFYNQFTWKIPVKDNEVFLTFDDGPVPGPTDFVLEMLDKYNYKATFFCIGENVQKHPGLYQQLITAGHSVGNHTHQHLNGWLCKADDYISNVNEAAKYISSRLFRPPYGRIKKQQADILLKNYQIVMWDVLSYDFDVSISPAKCLQNVTHHTRAGSIVVFHDSVKAFPNLNVVLPPYLEFLKNNEFICRPLPFN